VGGGGDGKKCRGGADGCGELGSGGGGGEGGEPGRGGGVGVAGDGEEVGVAGDGEEVEGLLVPEARVHQPFCPNCDEVIPCCDAGIGLQHTALSNCASGSFRTRRICFAGMVIQASLDGRHRS